MTKTQLVAKIRRYTITNSTTYPDSELLPDVYDVKNELASLIAERNDNLWMIPSLDDLVVSSATAREYPLPEAILNHFFTVEAAFDADNPTIFVPILPYPGGLQRLIREINGITEAKIIGSFDNNQPYYYLTRRGIYILSGTIEVVSNGLKIRYRKYPADLADLSGSTDLSIDPSTTTFGIPKQFHELWARRVSMYWKQMRPKPIPLSTMELNYENDLKKQLDAISQTDMAEEIVGFLPSSDSPRNLGQNV